MAKVKDSVPSRKQIAEYWCDKYISKDFDIIDSYEEGAEPVIADCGEPECWACGMFNEKIYQNKMYDALLHTKNYMRIWNFPEVTYLQKAHILSNMLGGKSIPENYFLLCKECHQESPDFKDTRFFYAYIRHTRANVNRVNHRRYNELQRAIHELAFQLHKNILTIAKGVENIGVSQEKMGLHITSISLYTIASAIVYRMDELNSKALSDDDIMKMQEEYLKYDIKFKIKGDEQL